ncbi:hypothetical protein PUN28_010827 [Cardiocondyla obscurior]|uniref:Secreted protein n=1 Tax=Cardiocondyla obscurior TaxID=286306 RepID=A0AAW2FIB1_9HYME
MVADKSYVIYFLACTSPFHAFSGKRCDRRKATRREPKYENRVQREGKGGRGRDNIITDNLSLKTDCNLTKGCAK